MVINPLLTPWTLSSYRANFGKRLISAGSLPFYDVVIVGGATAGLSLAAALRSKCGTQDLKMAVIESSPLAKWKSTPLFSSRTVSLTRCTVNFLNDIGAWKFIDGSRVQAYKDMQVWDGISGSRITFPSDEPHGTITEISNLQNCLLDRLNELGRVDIFSQQQVLNITRPDEFPVISLSSGKAIQSRLLIGADGVNSPVRTFASIESRGWDYGHGVVSTLKTSRPTLTAWQRFLPTGPIALLPLPDGYASLVWSTTSQLANRFKSMSSRDFSALITAAFRLTPTDLSYISTESSDIADEVSWRLQCTRVDGDVPPSVLEASNIACFPLRMRHADTYISDRVALVGDAAHTIHPLAGQGLNMGMQDVQSLTAVLSDAVYTGSDIGSTIVLEQYNRKRYFDNHVRIGVCDKLCKLYSTTWAPIVGIRSLGVDVFEKMGWLKDTLRERV